ESMSRQLRRSRGASSATRLLARASARNPHAGDVANMPAARFQVGFVSIERDGNCRGPRVAVAVVAARTGDGAGSVLCLPEVPYVPAVGVLEVIGAADGLYPIAPCPIGDANRPSACRAVPAIAQPDPWTDPDEPGFLCHR